MENIKVANENFDWAAFESESGLYPQSKEEIAAQYDNTMSNIAVGETVEGTVTEINKREVIVNIGYKSEGVIAASEFRYDSELKVGDKVEVYVESVEDKG
ncbi:MAG: S1 RNA-binding domain-containing protein, partial [Alistipes sp.]|nr:S1 RNA-binding domain-containing protein [Alistipes sp.]